IEAAGIETHALADQRHLRSAAPAYVDQAGAALRAMAHGMDQREVLLLQRLSFDDRYLGAVFLRKFFGGSGEFGRPHVVGWRVDKIAGQEHAFGDTRGFRRVGSRRNRKLRRFAFGFAIAVEFVGAERPGDECRRAGERLRDIAQRIGAGGKRFGERGECQRILSLAEAENRAGQTAGGIGHQADLAVLRCEAGTLQPVRLALTAAGEEFRQIRRSHRVERHRSLCARGKALMHEDALCWVGYDSRNPHASPQGEAMTARYTLVIGTKDWSSWSLRPYMALRHIGVPLEEDLIQLRRDSTTEEVQKRSPSGRVPLLKIEENGKAWSVWDS